MHHQAMLLNTHIGAYDATFLLWNSSLLQQVRGTTRCVKSDKGGKNCKICLNLLFSLFSSRHLTKPQTFGTICHNLVPFGTILVGRVPLETI